MTSGSFSHHGPWMKMGGELAGATARIAAAAEVAIKHAARGAMLAGNAGQQMTSAMFAMA
eukprot:CAMPEP_0197641620 /NCGR_PEP_ID=MMETSP1338-20131121/15537_1 /TAXON_ID=43686 ORGANISM="Pelagodinium beii, Strain RCC1491" /NCGR_SAMPLE_ID=MMETSP1338 /ASSEMBLY_ACC=CAM_ASM_000754 /LENGTH=59 /DNA_ID=CAMNT_0043214637 /DNA_START=136 /DNA_END=315 /DNA_ORIENTATION=+